MNENKMICQRLRAEFSKSGWALLLYYGIMNAAVSAVAFVSVFAIIMEAAFDPSISQHFLEQQLVELILGNGWGYLLAIVIGAVLMVVWKKRDFCFKTIWKTEKPMKVGSFFCILAIFFSGQALSQLMTPVLEWLFGLMGISLTDFMESASASADTFSMFLYICLSAPVSEELLFRGLIMRSLEPYGKKFAILTSSFLFGIFHGNIVQSPYAFVVGLVLGYVAMEHSMVWAMLLHMINNLLLADTLPRLTQSLPVLYQEIIFAVVIWGSAIAAVVILIVKRKQVAAYLRQGKMHPLCLKSFFTSPGILTLTGVLAANVLLTLLMQSF